MGEIAKIGIRAHPCAGGRIVGWFTLLWRIWGWGSYARGVCGVWYKVSLYGLIQKVSDMWNGKFCRKVARSTQPQTVTALSIRNERTASPI